MNAMIAILQPYIPHYREQFFQQIGEKIKHDLICYEKPETASRQHFKEADIPVKSIKCLSRSPFLIYNPFNLLKYEVLVLMLNFSHLSTWLLLLTKFIHRKKIILWGHGISVKRYAKEMHNPSFLLKGMIAMADGLWLYTPKEVDIWRKPFPGKQIISLNNTVSEVESILSLPVPDISGLKQKYGITQERVFIYCARFNEPARRVDMLESIIRSLDSLQFAFIIIGDGDLKPDFSVYKNVYDFGTVYDRQKKNELFGIADIYIQPGWAGLSIVEAMAYAKPVFTFQRTEDHLQCVEYAYIENNINGKIFGTEKELLSFTQTASIDQLRKMGENARMLVKDRLTMESMSGNAVASLVSFYKNKPA